jgi:hypothetical protein
MFANPLGCFFVSFLFMLVKLYYCTAAVLMNIPRKVTLEKEDSDDADCSGRLRQKKSKNHHRTSSGTKQEVIDLTLCVERHGHAHDLAPVERSYQ